MDRRERIVNDEELDYLAAKSNKTRIWTAVQGFVNKFPGTNGGAMTCDVQPATQVLQTDEFGQTSWVTLPVLQDCPILWQGGGGMTLTFPINAATDNTGIAGSGQTGDECLVIIASRCIDRWWQFRGIQPAAELRMHNLSDGFALIGVRSLPHSFTPDLSNVALTSDDGSFYWKMNPTTKAIKGVATGGITLNNVVIDTNGNITLPSGADLKNAAGTTAFTHTHGGVTTGSGVTGTPTPGS